MAEAAALLKMEPQSFGGRFVVTIVGSISDLLDIIWKMMSVSSFL
jgi:hypothetical protein